MTILVAYVPRPEGQAALEKGIEISKRDNQRLIVVNASTSGSTEDGSLINAQDAERLQQTLDSAGINAEFKQFVRGRNVTEEIEYLIESLNVSLLIIGIRKRSPVGKFIMGSIAQEILLSVSCPVLAVKAN